VAHIEDRWFQPKGDVLGKLVVDGRGKPVMEPTDRHRKGNRYRVRYVDPRRQEQSRSFPDGKKRAVEAFLVEVESDKLRGSYVDPKAGRISSKEYADAWLATRRSTSRPARAWRCGFASTRTRLRALGAFGNPAGDDPVLGSLAATGRRGVELPQDPVRACLRDHERGRGRRADHEEPVLGAYRSQTQR
jgi:hypothetical protein